MRIISPSLLSADFRHIEANIAEVETAGVNRLHLDIMDGHLCNVMISYNNHPDIIHRFEEWYQYDFAHTYTMRSTGTYMIDQTKRRELICLNYGKYRSQSVA